MMFRRYDVFLSYARTDTERVKPLAEALSSLGYQIFFDVQSIHPGERWKKRLENSVRASRAMVLCWSQAARTSDFVTFEYARSEALGRRIYPWQMDNTPLPVMLEVQAIEAQDPRAVAGALQSKLGWPLKRRRIAQAVAAACLVAASAVIGWKLLHPAPWQPEDFITATVAELATSQGSDGGARVQYDPAAPEQAWNTAQVIRAETASPQAANYAGAVQREMAYIKHMKRSEPETGWGYYTSDRHTITEIGAWVTVASIESLRSGAVWNSQQSPKVVADVQQEFQELCQRQVEGGWGPINVKDERYTRTYSTTMMVWALEEAEHVEATRTMAAQFDPNLQAGVRWLLANYDPELGWVPNPHRRPQDQPIYALTAQTYFVLSRVALLPQFAWLPSDPVFRAARTMLLTETRSAGWKLTDAERLASGDQLLYDVKFPGAASPEDFRLEGSSFLWCPWMLAAYGQMQRDASVTASEKSAADDRSRYILRKIQQGHAELAGSEVFVLAEMMIGMEGAEIPSGGSGK